MDFFDSIGNAISGAISTIHDDVVGLVGGIGHLFEKTQDNVVSVIHGNQELIGGAVNKGIELVDHTVVGAENVIGDIGKGALDTVKGIFNSPVLLIGGGLALFLIISK